jgi:uncharacterized protein DUF4126
MDFNSANIAALIVAASFAAGLNVYATLGTLGLLSRFSWVDLPPGLDMLGHTWILVTCLILFAAEFVADKIPGLDVVWSALHTVVRIPVAALIAYRATMQLSPEMQVLAAVAGGLIALASHGSKTAVRAAVTPSPEPISNIALSTGEDVLAVGVTWLATRHPFVAATIAAVLTLIAVLMMRWLVKWARRMLGKTRPASGAAQRPSSP